MARKALPDVKLVLATNGLLMTEDIVKRIAGTGINVYVSLHRPEKAQGAIAALSKHGILTGVSCDPAIASTNWAGQMKWPVTTPAVGKDCTWVKEGKVIVMADGRVSRCSFDADGCGPYEKTWTCEMMGYQWGADVAREAAKTWWEDTDQSGECELTVLIERWDGVQKRWRIKVTMEVKARVVR
jgi:hypothetical protein